MSQHLLALAMIPLLVTTLLFAACTDKEDEPVTHPADASSPESPKPAESSPAADPAAPSDAAPARTRLATFGAGCFWCTEAVFQRLKGVVKVTSGYSGGTVENPSYKLVCTGTTGHAEVSQIEYDPSQVSYADLLEVFFEVHDPTTLNRQGADVGTQYRSVIFYHDAEQKALAEKAKKEIDAAGVYEHPLVTEIVPFEKFYPAEDYHQDYFDQNPEQGYCRAVIRPKVEKFKKIFAEKLK